MPDGALCVIGSVIAALLQKAFFVCDLRERRLEHRERAVRDVAQIPV
jgi:hypothetical protein